MAVIQRLRIVATITKSKAMNKFAIADEQENSNFVKEILLWGKTCYEKNYKELVKNSNWVYEKHGNAI